MAKSTTSDTRLEKITRMVRLDGIADIMFDRYAGTTKQS